MTPASPSRSISGIAYMMLGVASFAAMDTIGKWLVRDFSIFQILALRSSFVTLLILAMLPFVGGGSALASRQTGAHVFRALCGAGAFVFFFTSVRFLPLADAVAVAFGSPFIVTSLSVPLLGEVVDGRRWLAIGAGFVGMLLIVQPTSDTFQPAALLVILSSFSYASMMVLTRWMHKRSGSEERTLTFVFYTFLIQALCGWLAMGFARWRDPSRAELALILAMGVLALLGHFGITLAFQRSEVAVVAPFEYTALLWATLFGFLVFGDFPQLAVWLGVAVIVAAGLYTLHRERRTETP